MFCRDMANLTSCFINLCSDADDDCAGNLICKQRTGFEAVPGCSGEGGSTDLYAKDICVKPALTDIVLNGDCTNCGLCTGDW